MAEIEYQALNLQTQDCCEKLLQLIADKLNIKYEEFLRHGLIQVRAMYSKAARLNADYKIGLPQHRSYDWAKSLLNLVASSTYMLIGDNQNPYMYRFGFIDEYSETKQDQIQFDDVMIRFVTLDEAEPEDEGCLNMSESELAHAVEHFEEGEKQ